jgi:hypothetical protein
VLSLPRRSPLHTIYFGAVSFGSVILFRPYSDPRICVSVDATHSRGEIYQEIFQICQELGGVRRFELFLGVVASPHVGTEEGLARALALVAQV